MAETILALILGRDRDVLDRMDHNDQGAPVDQLAPLS
jgi:hypothetical protein